MKGAEEVPSEVLCRAAVAGGAAAPGKSTGLGLGLGQPGAG